MPDTPLPLVDERVDQLAMALPASRPGSCWRVVGPASAGKSTFLRRLAQKLRVGSSALWPIVIAPPRREFDSSALALADLAGGLADFAQGASSAAGFSRGEIVRELTREASWTAKTGQLRKWLEAVAGRVVLLVDDPALWIPPDADAEHFGRRAGSVHDLLLASPVCRRVIAGGTLASVANAERIELPRQSDQSWLTDSISWGPLASAASYIREDFLAQAATYSPLELRLLVALAAVSPRHVPKRLPESRRALANLLEDALRVSDEWKALAIVWARLALLRRPFEVAFLEAAGAHDLSETARAVLDRCLLFNENERLVLHELLKLDTRGREMLSREASVSHGAFAETYVRSFQALLASGGSVQSSLENEAEAFYHFAACGDPSHLDIARPFFSEQLDLLGRTLSRERGERLTAADIFERASRWDPDDDYAHHYRAYNLDFVAHDAGEVERRYVRALELDDSHVWYWSRFIRFLLTRGRTDDALVAWNDALDALSLPDPRRGPRVYEEMHAEIAALALHRGLLWFAALVLDAVPSDVAALSLRVSACRRRLRALELAREGRAVVPSPRLTKEWWKQPERLEATIERRQFKLVRWLAARVEAVTEKRVDLRYGEVHVADPMCPQTAFTAIDIEQLESWQMGESTLQEGDYVEIGEYKNNEQSHFRVHVLDRLTQWHEPGFPPLIPPPDRWIRSSA